MGGLYPICITLARYVDKGLLRHPRARIGANTLFLIHHLTDNCKPLLEYAIGAADLQHRIRSNFLMKFILYSVSSYYFKEQNIVTCNFLVVVLRCDITFEISRKTAGVVPTRK